MRRRTRSPAGTDRVAAAFVVVPREGFLPASQRRHAHEDRPLPLGHGQTSSQPSTVAAMLRLLDVPEGARVLDVGAGSGWTTALLAHLVGPGGTVLGLELEPDLARWGAANLTAHLAAQPAPGAAPPSGPAPEGAHTPGPGLDARLEPARDGLLGDPAGAPWDRILVSADARELPRALTDQLGAGGRMVAPVRGEMLLVVRPEGARDPRELVVTTHGAYRFVPLR